jgi:hypothetical protein
VAEGLQRRLAAGRVPHEAAVGLQAHPEGGPDVPLVVHDQDPELRLGALRRHAGIIAQLRAGRSRRDRAAFRKAAGGARLQDAGPENRGTTRELHFRSP